MLLNPNVHEKRRGSVVESRTDANNELILYSQKQVKVRTPRRGRSKSIVVPGTQGTPRSFPIGRLNNYNKIMKKHRGPLSFMSELESIEEDEMSEKCESGFGEPLKSSGSGQGRIYFDAEIEKEFKQS